MRGIKDPLPERQNLVAPVVRNHLASRPSPSAEMLQVLVSALPFNISKSSLEACSNGFKIKNCLLRVYITRAVPVNML